MAACPTCQDVGEVVVRGAAAGPGGVRWFEHEAPCPAECPASRILAPRATFYRGSQAE